MKNGWDWVLWLIDGRSVWVHNTVEASAWVCPADGHGWHFEVWHPGSSNMIAYGVRPTQAEAMLSAEKGEWMKLDPIPTRRALAYSVGLMVPVVLIVVVTAAFVFVPGLMPSNEPEDVPPAVLPMEVEVTGHEPGDGCLGVYRAVVTRVVDGDTLDLEITLGHHLTTTARVRLLGVDTPETHGNTKVAGLEAKAYTERLAAGKSVFLRSTKEDAFGRWLGEIWVEGRSLSAELLRDGQAIPYRD